MNAAAIATLVADSALRFGDRNPQQLKQLSSRLSKVPEAEVASGLLRVFTHGSAPPAGTAAQELAGQLLAELCPRAEVNLSEVLRASLDRYELSVEQLPLYLGSLFGTEVVLGALLQIELEALSPPELRALRTMRFWLRGRSREPGQNVA
jgi:hypothetical protein